MKEDTQLLIAWKGLHDRHCVMAKLLPRKNKFDLCKRFRTLLKMGEKTSRLGCQEPRAGIYQNMFGTPEKEAPKICEQSVMHSLQGLSPDRAMRILRCLMLFPCHAILEVSKSQLHLKEIKENPRLIWTFAVGMFVFPFLLIYIIIENWIDLIFSFIDHLMLRFLIFSPLRYILFA